MEVSAIAAVKQLIAKCHHMLKAAECERISIDFLDGGGRDLVFAFRGVGVMLRTVVSVPYDADHNEIVGFGSDKLTGSTCRRLLCHSSRG